MNTEHHKVVIVGGGASGISVAANLRRKDNFIDIAIIEPSDVHYYQPAFTVVGGGEYDFEKTKRSEAALMPRNVKWIKDAAATFEPTANRVQLQSGNSVSYDYLVLCPGIQLDWHKIAGLQETLGKNNVCSNYSPDTVRYTWECIQNFKGGTALFTQPPMPIKCAGAPQKIMYLAADRFRQRGLLDKTDVLFCNAGPAMFGIPFFARELDKVADSYGAKRNFNCNLVAVNGPAKTAIFEKTNADGDKDKVEIKFDMLHVTPPQSAPDFIKQSPFANEAGWIDVNKNTLQQTRFSNVFGLGDAGSTPNAKTAAAVRKQVPVVADNILKLAGGQSDLSSDYDGYGSCPLTTSLSTVILAEFAYDGRVTPSFPVLDPRAGRYVWWLGKKYLLPLLYWNYMLKGANFDIPHRQAYVEKLLASV
jgi:sulfide:quinone oxidoreductase